MTKQKIFETPGGLVLANDFLDLAPCQVRKVSDREIDVIGNRTWTAMRMSDGWAWVGKANCPARAGREMQQFLSRAAKQ